MNFSPLTRYLDSLPKTQQVPGCDCVVLHHHHTVYRHCVGFSDADGRQATSERDIYYLFSATKVITCTAVMQLVEQDRLGLTDEISRYLPEFSHMQVRCEDGSLRPAARGILVADLLTMTSGLTYDIETEPILALQRQSGGEATTREIMAAIAASSLACDPGEHWIYSLSHDVLAGLIEVVTGQTFGQYLRENIFDPLGMKDVYFQLPAAEQPRLAALYARSITGPGQRLVPPTGKSWPEANRFRLSKAYESGGAGLAATVNDYAKFLDAMICGGVAANGYRLLQRGSIDTMRHNFLNEAQMSDFRKTGKKGYGYGLGVRTLIDPEASHGPVGEFGWDGAAGAYVMIDPENEIGIFYAQHILGHIDSYFQIHPTIRDLVYDILRP